MERFVKFFIVHTVFISIVHSKELHLKQDYFFKDKGDLDIVRHEKMEHFTDHERYARHAVAITESVLEHLIKEINKKYPEGKNNKNATVPKMMRRLKMKLKNHINKQRHKKKKHELIKTIHRRKTTVAI